MKLLNMNEWAEACKKYRPEYILEKPAAVGYWRSSISEHYWKLIPGGFRERNEEIDEFGNIRFIGPLVWQDGHRMRETTQFEQALKEFKK